MLPSIGSGVRIKRILRGASFKKSHALRVILYPRGRLSPQCGSKIAYAGSGPVVTRSPQVSFSPASGEFPVPFLDLLVSVDQSPCVATARLPSTEQSSILSRENCVSLCLSMQEACETFPTLHRFLFRHLFRSAVLPSAQPFPLASLISLTGPVVLYSILLSNEEQHFPA